MRGQGAIPIGGGSNILSLEFLFSGSKISYANITLQEHQTIRTNVTVSKVSDILT